MQRPLGDPNLICPLHRKKCSKVCHTCPFWLPLELTVSGQTTTDWRCALAWGPTLQTINNARMDGLGAAMEQTRNGMAVFRRSVLDLVALLAGTSLKQVRREKAEPLQIVESGDAAK